MLLGCRWSAASGFSPAWMLLGSGWSAASGFSPAWVLLGSRWSAAWGFRPAWVLLDSRWSASGSPTFYCAMDCLGVVAVKSFLFFISAGDFSSRPGTKWSTARYRSAARWLGTPALGGLLHGGLGQPGCYYALGDLLHGGLGQPGCN